MLGLPKSTEMSKQLPKKAVYAKFQMNTAAKEKIDADISRITIVNEIIPAKINIPAGEEVGSFFVLLVALKKKDFDEKTVATLSKLIPQNILFVLEFEGQSKLAIYHTKLMQTDWKPTESCTIELRGLNLDKVWENIVVDIGGVSIADGNPLDEQIAVHIQSVVCAILRHARFGGQNGILNCNESELAANGLLIPCGDIDVHR